MATTTTTTTTTSTSLSEEAVHEAIDNVLASEASDVVLRRATESRDWNSIMSIADPAKENGTQETRNLSAEVRTPFYFGIQALNGKGTLIGFCTFYIAYSTWDGRMLYADQIQPESDGSLLLYHIMAKISTEIGCSRFTWKVRNYW